MSTGPLRLRYDDHFSSINFEILGQSFLSNANISITCKTTKRRHLFIVYGSFPLTESRQRLSLEQRFPFNHSVDPLS